MSGGFIIFEVQYIDGTKTEANANKYTFVWKMATRTNQDKLELKDESDNVMTTEEMQKRTDDILYKMDEKGISDKKLRKAVS